MSAEYVEAGFLSDVYEPWQDMAPLDTWGEYLQALWEVASRAVSASVYDKVPIVIGWMREELDRAFDEHWWGDEEEYLPLILDARDRTQRVIQSWQEQAESFNGSAVFEATLASLPTWMRPVDPRERLRLKVVGLEEELEQVESKKQEVENQLDQARRNLEEADVPDEAS